MRGPHLQNHVTHRSRGHVTNQKQCISTFTRTMDPKLSRVVSQDEGTYPQCHVTLQHRGHLTNQKRYISTSIQCMDPKFSRVVTQDEGNPPTKSRDTSIVLSRDKSKIFCLHFHKAQGPQTQQDGDQNEKTPSNMSCATSTTPSRDNYLVGSVHVFHFQLKLSPKNRQISNDYDNTENVQLV